DGRGSAAVVRPHDRAQGGEPDRVAAPLVTEQVSPAASAGGAPVLRAAPGDGAGPGDDEQAGPRGEGVVESSLDVADDVDLTGDLEAGECIADRAALGLAARAGECAAERGRRRRGAGGIERAAREGGQRSRARAGVRGVEGAGGAPDAGQRAPGGVRRDDGGARAAPIEAEVDRAGARARAGPGVHLGRDSAPATTSGSSRAPRPPRSAALAEPTTTVRVEPINANHSVSTTLGMRPNCWAAQSAVMTMMAAAMPVIASRCAARRETAASRNAPSRPPYVKDAIWSAMTTIGVPCDANWKRSPPPMMIPAHRIVKRLPTRIRWSSSSARPESGAYRSCVVADASELSDDETVDIIAARIPAMMTPESPGGSCSMMN